MRLESPPPLLSWKEASTQLGRNMAGATRYAIPNMLNNTKRLNMNALIVASLVLVLSRIAVANLSALDAKGTPEGSYRYQESIRTTLREIGGWTFSFAILRQLQKVFEVGLKKIYGIKAVDPSVPPTFFGETAKNIKAFVQRQPLSEPIRWTESAEEGSFSFTNNRFSQKTVKLLQKVPTLAQREAKTLIRGTYNWAPILLGSIPSVILSGFFLEAFTRDKSDEVVQTVSRLFNDDDEKTKQAGPASPGVSPFAEPALNASLPVFGVQPQARPLNLQV